MKLLKKVQEVVRTSLEQCSRLVGNPLEIVGPVLKSSENLSTPSVIFGSHREIFGNHRNLWQSSEVFQKLRQSLEAVSKSLEIQVL